MVLLLLVGGLAICAYQLLEPELQISRKCRAHTDEMALRQALLSYAQRTGEFPSQAQSLDALVRKPIDAPTRWLQQLAEPIEDPWGHVYQYERTDSATTAGFRVYSFGPNKSDSSDDIVLSYPELSAQNTAASHAK
jgi:general secretion pathway protein G